MDYGHTDKKEEPFFTDGAGTNDATKNDTEPQDNLDLSSNGSAAWGNNAPVRDPRLVGGGVFNAISSSPNTVTDTNTTEEKLGQVIDMQMPPGVPSPEVTQNSETKSINDPNAQPQGPNNTNDDNIIDISQFREDKGAISAKTLSGIEHTVSDFNNGKISPSDLVEKKYEATRSYLKNSFGRELAA